MFNLRHKRTTRDRESGLVFQWRLPISNHFSFFAAIGVVALITAGLAATVRIRVGNVARQPERRGSLILVPQGKDWRALEILALEAGPMPRREDPAHDPAVAAIFHQSVATATPPGYRYAPSLRPVAIEIPAAVASSAETPSPGVLPPLPEPAAPSQNPPRADPSRPLVLASGGVRAIAPAELPPASLARGDRYLLGYDARGRVTQVTTLYAAEPAADDRGELWLRRIVIEGGTKGGGWAAVEISSGS